MLAYQIKNRYTRKYILTSINGHMHDWPACTLQIHTKTHIHTTNKTGKYSADQTFMCVDLSLAIKIHLIFTRAPLHFCFLNTRLLQPLSLTFSPAHKTPAVLLFSSSSASSLPSSLPSLLPYLFIYCDLCYDSIFIGCVCVPPPPPPLVLALFFRISLFYCANTLPAPGLFFS